MLLVDHCSNITNQMCPAELVAAVRNVAVHTETISRAAMILWPIRPNPVNKVTVATKFGSKRPLVGECMHVGECRCRLLELFSLSVGHAQSLPQLCVLFLQLYHVSRAGFQLQFERTQPGKSCVTNAHTAGVISARSSGGISCDCGIALVPQLLRNSQTAVSGL
jgi:hypothetical protein